MIVAGANLLVYALHAQMPQHHSAWAWLGDCLNGDEPLALRWVVILAVVRLSTNSDHWRILSGRLRDADQASHLTPDAHLAALAIEHDAQLHSCDGEFRRFAQRRFRNPLT